MTNDPPPLLVCLHFLAGSARGWQAVADRLGTEFTCLAVDLPGFGNAHDVPGYTVADMADYVADIVRNRAPRRWMLAGHSMGAKVATVLARRAEDGEPGLQTLAGMVLLAGSPPGPEPMEPAQRAKMLTWLQGSERSRRADAERYVDQNSHARIAHDISAPLIDDILQANPAAWTAWLEGGSREDWSDRVGILHTPALILAGAKDAALGPDGQRNLMLPYLAYAEMVVLADTAHLLPMEWPDLVARLITETFANPPAVPDAYRLLIGSHRVSSGTRAALTERAGRIDRAGMPHHLTPVQRGTLRALVARVIPQSGRGRIDLSARLEAQLGGSADGWRPAELPPDAMAWRAGLDTLEAHEGGFAGLDPVKQDALLDALAAGKIGSPANGMLDASRMVSWFEDVCSEATRLAMAHPATLARIGYSGIGYGGDGPDKPGFVQLGIGEREMWEPVAR